MPARRESDGMPDIYETMKDVFVDALVDKKTHTRNCAALFKLHCAVVCRGATMEYGGKEGAHDFMESFLHFLGTCLTIREARQSDLGTRFAATYIKYLNDKVGIPGHDYLQFYSQSRDDPATSSAAQDLHEPAPWFTGRVLKSLLRGARLPKAQTRRRSIADISLVLDTLGDIDARHIDDAHRILRERLGDKDKAVRQLAATALGLHMYPEDEDALLDAMTCDPASDVRLAVVVAIPLSTKALHCLLLRCRDDGHDIKPRKHGEPEDARVRAAAYRRLAVNTAVQDAQQIPTHPDTFVEEALDKLLSYGLNDRHLDVRKEATKLV
ncbi:hypothetical protein BD626DRAFT_369727, partial [Schizophyllum amplum]